MLLPTEGWLATASQVPDGLLDKCGPDMVNTPIRHWLVVTGQSASGPKTSIAGATPHLKTRHSGNPTPHA
jgi:hypothetical protein